jgi:hypothetical protein
MPNFETYERSASRLRHGSTVTVLRRGLVVFSPDAMRDLGQPDTICYLVDRDERLLGFRKAKRGEKGAYAVHPQRHTATAILVLRHLGHDLSTARRYDLQQLDGTWCIDLKQQGKPVSRGQ